MVKKRQRRNRDSRGRNRVAATPHVVHAPRLPLELCGGLALPLGYAASGGDEPGASDPPRIAILLHLYFDDLGPELWGYLRGFPFPADLYVTTNTEEKRNALTAQFADWSRGRMEVRLVPNRGRDIAPRLVGLADVLAGYELCLHVHGKHSRHWTRGGEWRTHLLGTLLGPGMVEGAVEAFRQSPRLGLVMPRNWPAVVPGMDWGFDFDRAHALAARMDIAIDAQDALDFPAGSMFWSRAGALQPLLDLNLDFGDFEPEDGLPRGSLAHAIERLLLLVCEHAGFDWLRIAGELPAPPHFDRATSPDDLRGIVARRRLRLRQDATGGATEAGDGTMPRFVPDWVAGPRVTLLLLDDRTLPRTDPGGGAAILGRLPIVTDGAVAGRLAAAAALRDRLPQELRALPFVGLEAGRSALPLAPEDVLLATCWRGATAALALRDGQHRSYGTTPPKLWFMPPAAPPPPDEGRALSVRADEILILDAPWSSTLGAPAETIAVPAIWDPLLALPRGAERPGDPPVILVDWSLDGESGLRAAVIAALSEIGPASIAALGDGTPMILADGRRVDPVRRGDGVEWSSRLASARLGLAPPWNDRAGRLRHEMSAFGLPVIDAADWPSDAAALRRRIAGSLDAPPPPRPVRDDFPAPFHSATALDRLAAALAARLAATAHPPSVSSG